MAREIKNDLESLFGLLENPDSLSNKGKDAEQIVSNINDRLKGYSETLLGNDVAILLASDDEESNNLNKFISKALTKTHLLSAVVTVLRFLEELCRNYKNILCKFVEKIIKIGTDCVLAVSSSNVEVAEWGNNLIKAAIESLPNSECDLSYIYINIIKRQIDWECIKKPKVCASVFKLVKTLAERSPQAICSEGRWDLLRQVNYRLSEQTRKIESDTSSFPIIEGCFEALSGLFSLFSPIELKDYVEGFYSRIKDVIDCDDRHRHVAHRAAFSLIEKHAWLFSHMMRREYHYWHTTLTKWISGKNVDDKAVCVSVLRRFYGEMASLLVDEPSENAEDDRALSKYFMDYFKQKMEINRMTSSPGDLLETIEGLGTLMPAFQRFLNKKLIEELFEKIVQIMDEMFLRGSSVYYLPDYLSALANIGRQLGDDLSQRQLEALERMSIFLLYQCNTFAHNQSRLEAAVGCVISCMLTALHAGGAALEKFLKVVVYQGIIKACSKQPFIEHQIQNEVNEIDKIEKKKTVTDYVPFWAGLLSVNKDARIRRPRISERLQKRLADYLYDNFIESIIKMVDKLDVELKKKAIGESEWMENPNTVLEANNVGDMAIVMNLQFFCSDLFPKIDIKLHKKWISKLLLNLTFISSRNPLIHSYYNLLASVLLIAEKFDYFESQDFQSKDECLQQLRLYMESLLINIHYSYKEVQESCLRVMTASSIELVRPYLSHLPAAFEVLFRIGRNELDIAEMGVQALDRWMSKLKEEELRPFLKEVIPHLYPFLDNRRIKIAFPDHFMEYARPATSRRSKYISKRQQLLDSLRKEAGASETKLSKLQESILMLLGRLDMRSLLSLLDQDYSETVISWSRSPIVPWEVKFKDLHPTIYLDIFAPRTLEIALTSSDTENKDAAFELLQTIFILFIEKTSESRRIENTPEAERIAADQQNFLKKLLPGMFKLGCNTADPVARDLFHNLMMQTCHWYASNYCTNEEYINIFTEVLMDALTCPTDIEVREFSATCLREFITWTIKHFGKEKLDIDDDFTKQERETPALKKIDPIIQKINGYCLHPCPFKRQGAAMGFNGIYIYLREELALVNMHWLNLFYHFTKSLSLSDSSSQVFDALDHICRIFIERSDIFNKPSAARRKPPEFNGALLVDAVIWLLTLCSNTRQKSRQKSMDLINALAPKINKISSVGEFLEIYILKKSGNEEVIAICERYNEELTERPVVNTSSMSVDKVISWIHRLNATVHCYTWLQERGQVGVVDIIQSETSRCLKALQFFVSEVGSCSAGMIDYILYERCTPLDPSLLQADLYNRAKCDLTMNLIKLLNSFGEDVCKLENFFENNFWTWLSRNIINPALVGFTIVNAELSSRLQAVLMSFLSNIFQYLGENRKVEFVGIMLDMLKEKNCGSLLTSLPQMLDGAQSIKLKGQEEYLSSLMLLRKTNLITSSDENILAGENVWSAVGIIEAVFNSVADQSENAIVPESSQLQYLNLLLDFAFLSESGTVVTQTVVQCITNEDKLRHKDNDRPGTIEKGLHFLTLFSDQIYRYLLNDAIISSEILLTKLEDNFIKTIACLFEMFERAQSCSNSVKEDMVSVFFANWEKFEKESNKIQNDGSLNKERKESFIKVVSSVVKLLPNHNLRSNALAEPIVDYLFAELKSQTVFNNVLSYKRSIIDLLPALIQNSDSGRDAVLRDALQHFTFNSLPASSKEWKTSVINYSRYSELFRSMLRTLNSTGDLQILEVIVLHMAGDEDHPCKEAAERVLSNFKLLPSGRQANALRLIYGLFCEKGKNVYQYSSRKRISFVQDFLLLLIREGSVEVVQTFYTENIISVLNFLKDSSGITIRNSEEFIPNRIGAFLLVNALFGKFPESELTLATNSIVTASGEVDDSGAKLFKSCCGWALKHLKEPGSPSNELKDIYLLYKCSIFNTFITLFSNMLKETKFLPKYQVFFQLDKLCQIVPEEPIFIKNDFDEIPKKKKVLIGIRRAARAERSSSGSSVSSNSTSLDLFSSKLMESSLTEDFRLYDFSETLLRENAPANDEVSSDQMVIELEANELNNHQCMHSLCGVIVHLRQISTTPSTSSGMDVTSASNTKPPLWITFLKTALEPSKDNTRDNSKVIKERNARLLIIKLIQNLNDFDPTLVKPFAKLLLKPIVDCITNEKVKCFGDKMNYLIADVIMMLADWSSVAIPESDDVFHLLKFIFENTPHDRSDFFGHNVEILKTLVSSWKDNLSLVPHEEISAFLDEGRSKQEKQTSLKMICYLLNYNIQPYADHAIATFCKKLVRNIFYEKTDVKRNSSEVMALLFKYWTKGGKVELDSDRSTMLDNLAKKMLEWIQPGLSIGISNLIQCLSVMKIHHPPIVQGFILHVVPLITRLSGPIQATALDIIYTAVDVDLNKSFLDEVTHLTILEQVTQVLKLSNIDSQVAALKVISKLWKVLSAEQTATLIEEMIKLFSDHSSLICREIMYEILMSLYGHYQNFPDAGSLVTSTDSDLLPIKDCVKNALIRGLNDPNENCRNTLLAFWNDEQHLRVDLLNRLEDVFTLLYSPESEQHFLPNVVRLLLDICRFSPAHGSQVLPHVQRESAKNSEVLDMRLSRSHSSSVSSIYVSTVTSQSSSFSDLGSSQGSAPRIRATQQSLIFKPTIDQDAPSFGASTSYSISAPGTYQQSRQIGKSSRSDAGGNDDVDFKVPLKYRRVKRNKEQVGRIAAAYNYRLNEQLKRDYSEQKVKRESQVHLTRTYKKGELPDTDITNADVVKLLQNLAQRDNLIASQLISNLLIGILEEVYSKSIKSNDPKEMESFKLSFDKITNLLQNVFVKIMTDTKLATPGLVSVIFETFIRFHERFNFSPDLLTNMSNRSGLYSLGTLALEEMLRFNNVALPGCSNESSLIEASPIGNHSEIWLYLARLYRSMGEADIVQGIFEEKLASSDVRQALELEAAGHLKQARQMYSELAANSNRMGNDEQSDFIYEAYFKCAASLSDWSGLKTAVYNEVDNCIDKLWEDHWSKENLLPWLFKAELNCTLGKGKSRSFTDFMSTVKSWISVKDKEDFIEMHMGEELSMLYLMKSSVDENKARRVSESNRRRFLEEWTQIPSLAHNLIMNKCLQLQRLMDIESFLKVLKDKSTSSSFTDWFEVIIDLLIKWETNGPSPYDSLVHWEKRINYRGHFCSLLTDKLPVKKDVVSDYEEKYYLSLLHTALEQKNYYTAKKVLETKGKEDGANRKLWTLYKSRAILLLANKFKNQDMLSRVVSSWKTLDPLDDGEKLKLSFNLPLLKHKMEICQKLYKSLMQDPGLWAQFASHPARSSDCQWLVGKISSSKQSETADVDYVISKLYEKGLMNMDDATAVASEIRELDAGAVLAETHLTLAKYCLQQPPNGFDKRNSESKMIQSLLRAMLHGSREARQLFPILLTLPNLSSEHAEIFTSESEQVPEWMFLGWVNQILASLDGEKGMVLEALVIRLAEAYPVALQLPFNISRSCYKYKSPRTKVIVEKLDSILSFDKTTENFIESVHRIALPDKMLTISLAQLCNAIRTKESTPDINSKWDDLLEIIKLFSPLKRSDTERKTYPIYEEFGRRYKDDLKNIVSHRSGMSETFMKKILEPFSSKISSFVVSKAKDSKEYKKKTILLKSYSTWLSTFSTLEGDLEIPGQYTGDSRPIPERHIKISKFADTVSVMKSKTVPIKIGLIGHDGIERGFLVKHGEDLRQDQRIQQLLKLMDAILGQNIKAPGRKFTIGCYSVFPITVNLGLISWINNTVTLENFITSSLNKDETSIYNNLPNEYAKWLPKLNTLDSYLKAYRDYSRDFTITAFKERVEALPQDILRRSVLQLSQSMAAYHYLRTQIGASLSTMNICHWLLGIGDRHLLNTLVCRTDGQLYGIDFGHAFGTGTQFLKVPELIPFRLTPQMLNLFAPFKETGLIRETMVCCLETLRKQESLIMAVMEVFIQEPLIDWLKTAKQTSLGEAVDDVADDVWYPRQKVLHAKRKLTGANPATIMAEELEAGHGNKNYYSSVLDMLRGGDYSVRALKPSEGLTAREQVICLIDQATDEHILGKSWVGLQTWI